MGARVGECNAPVSARVPAPQVNDEGVPSAQHTKRERCRPRRAHPDVAAGGEAHAVAGQVLGNLGVLCLPHGRRLVLALERLPLLAHLCQGEEGYRRAFSDARQGARQGARAQAPLRRLPRTKGEEQGVLRAGHSVNGDGPPDERVHLKGRRGRGEPARELALRAHVRPVEVCRAHMGLAWWWWLRPGAWRAEKIGDRPYGGLCGRNGGMHRPKRALGQQQRKAQSATRTWQWWYDALRRPMSSM